MGYLNKTSATSNSKYDAATAWLNVGMYLKGLKDKDGNPIFVRIPLGIPVDTLADRIVRNVKGNSEGAKVLRAQQQLVDKLFAEINAMAEGDHKILRNLVVDLYKVDTNADEEKVEETIAVDFSAEIDEIFAD